MRFAFAAAAFDPVAVRFGELGAQPLVELTPQSAVSMARK